MDNNNYQNEASNGTQLEKPMTLGEWLITMIVLAIPCAGLVMMFVWGFGQGNTSRKNYCRAMLILSAIGVVLGILFYGLIFASVVQTMKAYY